MKRNNFSIESKLLGRDFHGLIEEVGGKAAGIELLRTLGEKDASLGINRWSIPDYAILSTKYFKTFENSLLAHKEELSEFMKNNNYYENRKKIYSLIKDKLNNKEIDNFIQRVKRKKIEHLHLRSSTTIEDWKDDKYFGFFKTIESGFSLIPNCKKERLNFKEIKSSISDLFCDFLVKKFYLSPDLDNESLGILAMQSVRKEYKDALHLTVYSSYPEKDPSTSYIEIWKVEGDYSFPQNYPRQLIKISKNNLEIFQMELKDDITLTDNFLVGKMREDSWNLQNRARFQSENPFSVNGKRCALSEIALNSLYSISQGFQNILEKSVNLEVIVNLEKDSIDFRKFSYVQLRPVPALNPYRMIGKLEHLTDDFILVGKTPFVSGSYKVEAPLAVPMHKKSGHRPYNISKELIMIENDNKIHRSYTKDSKIVALLELENSKAVSHGFIVEPSFEERKFWKSMGFLNKEINLYRYLYPVELQDDFEGDGKRYFPAEFGISKFPFILESDGREGRIYIRKKYEKEFNNPRPEGEPIFKKLEPLKKVTNKDDLPF